MFSYLPLTRSNRFAMHRLLLLLFLVVPNLSGLNAQVILVGFNQSPLLSADAGPDTIVCSGRSVRLGGDPAATGGSMDYFYLWSPAEGLDDSTSPNPTALLANTITYTLQVTDVRGCTATDEITIFADPCLGTDTDSWHTGLVVYPNPSSGKFILSGLEVGSQQLQNIEVINTLGKVVYTRSFREKASVRSVEIDTGIVDSGVYFLKLLMAGRVLSFRLLIR